MHTPVSELHKHEYYHQSTQLYIRPHKGCMFRLQIISSHYQVSLQQCRRGIFYNFISGLRLQTWNTVVITTRLQRWHRLNERENLTKRKPTSWNTLPVPSAYSECECKIACNKWKPLDMGTDWKRKESRSVSVFNKLPNRSHFLTSRVCTRNVSMYPLATDILSFSLNRRSFCSICPHYHKNWTTTLSRCDISETSPIY